MSEIVFSGVKRAFRRDGRDFPALDGIDLTVGEREFVTQATEQAREHVRDGLPLRAEIRRAGYTARQPAEG